MQHKLRVGSQWFGYRRIKEKLKAIFYCTYIDNPENDIKLIKNIDVKYYKLYINNKWSCKVTKFNILNKFLFRMANCKKKFLNLKEKEICRFYSGNGLFINNEKDLLEVENNEDCRAFGGKFFYRLLLDDIMIAIDGGKSAVLQNVIHGMIPYKEYKYIMELEYKQDELEYKLMVEGGKLEQKKKSEDELNRQINEERKNLESLWFKNGVKDKVYKEIDNIINSTNMEDNDDILDMEQRMLYLMEKYIISNKIQMDIYYYLENQHNSISFHSVYRKLEN